MLRVIEYIKNNQDWKTTLTAEPYNLSITDDGNFTILKYSQINSDFNNEIVRECRGLIIDKECNPVCIPFFKFANYGEPYADEIDWDSAIVEEKIDGSLIKVWHYGGSWIVSTNGTIFAKNASIGAEDGIELKASNKYATFAELFESACANARLDFSSLDHRNTYMFELVSPYNRIVVPYESIDIYHIGTRDNTTLQELEVDIGIKKPKIYQCGNLNDILEMASRLRYSEEGYVVKDKHYRRVKVKSPAYVAAHHLISGMNEKRLLELFRTNELSEFLTYFPEYKPHADALSAKIERLVQYLDDLLDAKVNGLHYETRKDFALVATKTMFPAFLFSYYDGKAKAPSEWIWAMANDKIIEHLSKCENAFSHAAKKHEN